MGTFKKICLALLLTGPAWIAAPSQALAAWTNLTIVPSAAPNISSARVCKSLSKPLGGYTYLYVVRYQVVRRNQTVKSISFQTVPFAAVATNVWNTANTATIVTQGMTSRFPVTLRHTYTNGSVAQTAVEVSFGSIGSCP